MNAYISAATHGAYSVRLPTGQIKPTSLLTFMVAESGSRKTPTVEEFFRPLLEVEKLNAEKNEIAKRMISDEIKITKIKIEKLIRKVASDEMKGIHIETDRETLNELNAKILKMAPRTLKSIYEDTSKSGLLIGLEKNLPFATIVTSEGTSVLQSDLFKNEDVICVLWDGEAKIIDRGNSKTTQLFNSTLSGLIAIQPRPLFKHFTKKQSLSIENGLLARFLTYITPLDILPKTTKLDNIQTQHSTDAHSMLSEIYKKTLAYYDNQSSEKKIIEFSLFAQNYWLDIHNSIQKLIMPGQLYHPIKEWASKMSQHIARIAANLAVFDGSTNSINLDHVQLAFNMCNHFAEHHRAIFNPEPEEVKDAKLLDDWLRNRPEDIAISVNKARQCCPNSIRGKRFYIAKDLLINSNRIAEFEQIDERTKKVSRWINLDLLRRQYPFSTQYDPTPMFNIWGLY